MNNYSKFFKTKSFFELDIQRYVPALQKNLIKISHDNIFLEHFMLLQ